MWGSLPTKTKPLVVLALILCGFTLVTIYLSLSVSGPAERFGEEKGILSWWSKPGGLAISAESIKGYIEAYLDDRSSINSTYYLESQGLGINHTTYSGYIGALQQAYTNYFSTASPIWLDLVGSRLSLFSSNTPLPEAPKQVITTDKSIEHLPKEFERWKNVMPDWNVRYFDDEGLIAWVKGNLGGTGAEKIWNQLPQRVLQTDIFR